jgi:ABC-2 type transport system permease protein
LKKIFAVARWEFVEKIKTRSFIISLILTPIIIITFSVIPAFLADEELENTKVIGVIDTEGNYFKGIRNFLEQYTIRNHQPSYVIVNLYKEGIELSELKRIADSILIKGNIEGYLMIYPGDSPAVEYRSMQSGNLRDTKRLEKAFNHVKYYNNLSSTGLDSAVIDSALSDTELREVKLDEYGSESETGFLEVFFTSLIFIVLLAFLILSSGGMLIRSLVEEKSNRLIEILVSSCTPGELLTGKILGLSSLALMQILIWTFIGLALTGNHLAPVSSFNNLLPMFIYFLLGFLLYTALFVGIGSIVTTEQEAQQVSGYLSLILFLPMIFAVSTIQNPDSSMVKILTYIPLTTPTIMLLKFNIKPVPVSEIIGTISLMLVSILFTIWFSAKIFKIGILSYGKMPSFKELFQWIKEK